jgi:hypothetical protein
MYGEISLGAVLLRSQHFPFMVPVCPNFCQKASKRTKRKSKRENQFYDGFQLLFKRRFKSKTVSLAISKGWLVIEQKFLGQNSLFAWHTCFLFSVNVEHCNYQQM